jgi:hypothetical protein
MSNAAAVGRRRGGKRSDALVGRALLVMGAAAVAFVIGAVVR